MKRDVLVDMPPPARRLRPRNSNRLKRELSQMVMEEQQQRFSQDEIRSVTAD